MLQCSYEMIDRIDDAESNGRILLKMKLNLGPLSRAHVPDFRRDPLKSSEKSIVRLRSRYLQYLIGHTLLFLHINLPSRPKAAAL